MLYYEEHSSSSRHFHSQKTSIIQWDKKYQGIDEHDPLQRPSKCFYNGWKVQAEIRFRIWAIVTSSWKPTRKKAIIVSICNLFFKKSLNYYSTSIQFKCRWPKWRWIIYSKCSSSIHEANQYVSYKAIRNMIIGWGQYYCCCNIFWSCQHLMNCELLYSCSFCVSDPPPLSEWRKVYWGLHHRKPLLLLFLSSWFHWKTVPYWWVLLTVLWEGGHTIN